jgi:hypothetical protein
MTAMGSAMAGSSQYQPPVARMTAPVAATPAAAAASATVSSRTAGHSHPGRIEEIVTTLGQHCERMGADAHCDQAGHQSEVQGENDGQTLRSRQTAAVLAGGWQSIFDA